MTYLLTRWVLRPLFQLTAITRKVADGNYSERVNVVSRYEVGQLVDAFNHMADNLEKIEHLRKKMVADMAHELRTPLTNLRGYLEGMIDSVVPPSRETFRMLEQEVLRLVNLVEDLQQLARADAARGVPRPPGTLPPRTAPADHGPLRAELPGKRRSTCNGALVRDSETVTADRDKLLPGDSQPGRQRLEIHAGRGDRHYFNPAGRGRHKDRLRQQRRGDCSRRYPVSVRKVFPGRSFPLP